MIKITGYEALDLIVGYFYNSLGDPLIITIVLCAVLVMMLASFKAPLSVIIVAIIPVIVGFALNSAGLNLISMPAWIIIVLFMAMAIFFSLFFVFIAR